MNLQELKKICNKIKGVKKTIVSRSKDGVFIYFKEVFSKQTGRFYNFSDFITLECNEESLRRCRIEYERFFINKIG